MEGIDATAPVFPRPRAAGDDEVALAQLLHLTRTHLDLDLAWISELHCDEYRPRLVSGDPKGLGVSLEELSRTPGMARKRGIGSCVAVPLLGPAGAPLGRLCGLSRRSEVKPNRQAIRFLALIGELVGDHLQSPAELARTEVRSEAERIRAVLAGDFVRIAFQPVVRLEDGVVIGYEALSRFDDPHFPTPGAAFAAAARAGLGVDLELLAVRQALAGLADVPAGVWLGLNLSAEALVETAVQDVLLNSSPPRLGIEITEHAQVLDYAPLAAATQRLRAAGAQIVVDDAGSGYASFRHILKLRPDVIKLDLDLVRDVDTDPTRQALARSLVGFAAEAGVSLVAEGIETAPELKKLRQLGIGFGQGRLLGRPGPLPHLQLA